MADAPKPSVGRIVHYVVPDTPVCRAAIVTGLGEPLAYNDYVEDGATLADLCVMNPTGMFFGDGVPQDERPANARSGGTWHWPERV